MERVSKHNYYLDIAQTVSERSTCLRRRFGAIIVKNDVIISTGYNGSPRGRANCSDLGTCYREQMKIPRGERYELSRENMLGAVLYMCCTDPKTGKIMPGTNSCMMCKKLIINAGISTVFIRDTETEFREIPVTDWVTDDDSLSGKLGY